MQPKCGDSHLVTACSETEFCRVNVIPRCLAILSLSPFLLRAQGLVSLPMYGLPSTAVVAGMADDAFGWAAQPGAHLPDRTIMAGLRCLRLSVEGAPPAVQGALVVPAGPGRVTLQGWHAGTPAFREMSAGVSYDAPLWESFSTGVGFGYGRLSIPMHASRGRLQARWGAVWRVSGGLRLSFRLEAVPGSRESPPPRAWTTPLSLAFGIGYRFSEQASLAAELFREEGRGAVFTPVLYYRPVPYLSLRTGIRTDDGSITILLSYRMRGLGVGVGGRQAGLLGWCGELLLDWRSKTEDLP